jgi:hypothetical protein
MALLNRWPSERREVQATVCGALLQQLTCYPADHIPLAQASSSLTPAGDTLLFTSTRSGPDPALFRMDLSTGEIVQVTETGRPDPQRVTPAADGRRAIAGLAGEDGEIVAIDLDTGEWETLAVFPDASMDGCHLSASGEYVVTAVTRGSDTTLTAVHTEGMRTVPILEELPIAAAPRFSPDLRNSVLYAVPQSSSGSEVQNPGLWCVEFDGTGNHRLHSPTGAGFTAASWLGTGEAILFVMGDEEGPIGIASKTDDGTRVLLQRPSLWARSNPNGSRIVALADRRQGGTLPASVEPDTYLLLLLDVPSGETASLATVRDASARPTFTPDGQSLLYADRDDQGHLQLYLLTFPGL